jgi:glycine cleavage system H protein
VVPEELRYSDEHEWARLEGDVVTVGITEFAQEQLGDIVFVEMPVVGDTVVRSAVVGELESTKSVSDVFTPVSGEVIELNGTLEGAPELINSDPYGEGWLFKIRVSGAEALDSLLDAQAYTALTAE